MLPVIFGLSGLNLTPNETSFFRVADPTGYILFARNIESPRQLRSLTDALRNLSGRVDLPILIDQEGGRVTRLDPPYWRSWGSATSLSEGTNDLERAARIVACNYEALGLELASVGVTVTCAPVLDIPHPGSHKIIGDRAFGTSPDIVSSLGAACLEGLHMAGIEGVIKHIPGHGRALTDSHENLPRVSACESELVEDSEPFSHLSHAPMAMTAHIVYEAWDPLHCASVSSKIISKQIRSQIGFEGLLISDDLSMKALSGSMSSRAVAVLAAGCDIALNCCGKLEDMEEIADRIPVMTDKTFERLKRATRNLRPANMSVALNKRIESLLKMRDQP